MLNITIDKEPREKELPWSVNVWDTEGNEREEELERKFKTEQEAYIYAAELERNKQKEEAMWLWVKLGDTPIDENECIETDFEHFPKGTGREEIWHWFEEEYNVSVAKDLMSLE